MPAAGFIFQLWGERPFMKFIGMKHTLALQIGCRSVMSDLIFQLPGEGPFAKVTGMEYAFALLSGCSPIISVLSLQP